jgi:imidazolonepropionase
LSLIEKAAMVVTGGKVQWVGPQKKLPKTKGTTTDLKGMTVLPGFVECHTHTLFSGNRSQEFEQRLNGVSYQEIAKTGGGILSTVKATRKSSAETLKKETQIKVNRFLAQGVTTLEIKTGYALNKTDELKCLKVIQSLKGPQIHSTFLGAHSLPPEFSNVKDYLQHLESFLPAVRKLAHRLDIWIEKGFFEKEGSRAYLQKAKDLGFEISIHADQLTFSGGTELAVELSAKSADHVIQLGDAEIRRIAKSETTAVLLPMADLYMKCAYPPARKLIDAGARVALATDFNPGTCPSQDLNLVGLLARLEMKMTLPEVLSAYTVGAAHVLGSESKIGSLERGKDANFICIKEDWTSLFYQAGRSNLAKTYVEGRLMSPQAK